MKITLMNKDVPVFDMEMENGKVVRAFPAINRKYAPVSMKLTNGVASYTDANYWFEHRCIPAGRDGLRKGLKNIGYETLDRLRTPLFLLEKSYGLSLSDQYWLKLKASNLKWSDVNFYRNSFSEDVGRAFFDDVTVNSPNLVSPDITTNGNLSKKWVQIGNDRYLYKTSSKYYCQEPYNEALASAICRRLEFESYVDYDLIIENGKLISACKNFLTEDAELISAGSLLYMNGNSPDYRYENYVKICKENGIADIEDRLDEMLVLDYLIANEDRHYGNFGVIRNSNTLEFVSVAPIFDSGSSMFYYLEADSIEEFNATHEIHSKAFARWHNESIKLVKNIERFDLSKLKDIDDELKMIFLKGNTLKTERADTLCYVIKERVKKLSEIFD